MIFTNMFPYGHVENFLEQELAHLSKVFDEIVIVPNQLGPLYRTLPASIRVDNSFAEQFHSSTFFQKIGRVKNAFTNVRTYQELKRDPSILLSPQKLKILLYFVSQSEYYRQWLQEYLIMHPHFKNGIFYTYWLHVQALGISLLKQDEYPDLKQVSRAHSMEIYLEDYPPGYLPFRDLTLPTIDHIYTISMHGQKRMLLDYPSLSQKISTSRLGVEEPGFLNPFNGSTTLSIVSTSFLVSEKRLDILIYALKQLAESKLYTRVTWNHFGNGPQEEELTSLAIILLGETVDWKFQGYVTNEKLLEFYKTHPIDLFINTSRTEGIPISIMEAQSCGIPVIATDVGGVSEIVNSKVGKLLSSHPTHQEIAQAIMELTQDKSQLVALRVGAKENWHNHYNAAINFENFAKTL